MRLREWIYSSSFLLALLATFSQAHAQGTLEKTHQDWESRVVIYNNKVAFRGLTAFSRSWDNIILVVKRSPKNCNFQYISMNVVLSEPATSSIDSNQLFGTLRVDDMGTRKINFSVQIEAGKQVAFVTITNFDNDKSIMDEFERGRTLLLKLNKQDLRFSLLGYTAASTRTLELCNQFNAYKADKDSFEAKEKVKSDKDYF